MYDLQKLKDAIKFNTVEILPSNEQQLDAELQVLIVQSNQSKQEIRHYIGFEISGQIHLGTGIVTALKIKKLQEAGVKCTIWLANYHTWLNNKLDGQMETIHRVAEQYFKPIFIECCRVVGCNVDQIDFLDANSEYFRGDSKGQRYLDYMIKAARNLSLSRVNKSVTVAGKKEGESVEFGILCYPVMQVADAFFLQSHLVHAGLDQRKCHVLMREIAPSMNEDFGIKIGQANIKPIAIHHKLLLSLGVSANDVQNRMTADITEDLKMSKSKPDSAVWVHDSFEEISRKLKKAYCPIPKQDQSLEEIEQEQTYNPILNWCENLIYPAGKHVFVNRPEKFGGDKEYTSYSELKKDYFASNLHPLDLKNGVARTLANWFEPIYQYAQNNPKGLELVKNIKK
ncbi:MAG: tyrosine--tRNA ligase [Patescibacteria group bacterium]